ncbi:MAG: hypothetical protein QOF78_2501 [Phycisphaerales bacterium]|jgi:hypothetical protein|nr:hypothetical protein [Phycisphaerales bacterium]
MSSSTTNTISVQCPCGKRLKAPASAVGRKAKCPKCGNVLTVAAPPPAASAEPEYDPLYDLADQAHSAAAVARAEPQAAVCPNCHSAMTAGAILCTSCGYDTRTGQTLSTSLATEASRPASARPAAAPSFPSIPGYRASVAAKPHAGVDAGDRAAYIRGTIISGVAALIGAFIWFAIAKGIEREIGWVAWGIGVMAGFGMMIGANGNSVTAGMIAAIMATAGIMLGKVMVFCFVVLPMFSNILDKTFGRISAADKLELTITDQQLEKKKIDVESATDAQRDIAKGEAKTLIAKMDAKTRQAETQKAVDSFNRLVDEARDEIPKSRLFFSTMFAPIDILFFVLAVASAFKVATFGGERED